MKVLHIMNKLLPSGAEVMLEKAAQIWDSHEMTILSTTKEIGPYAEELEKVGYTVIHIHHNNQFIQWRLITNYIKKEKFDAVHIHRESKSYVYASLCRFAGVKCIVRTVHNVFLLNGLHRIREILTRKYEKLIGVQYIAISKSVHDHELQCFFNKCEIINNWYDVKKFYYIDDCEKEIARKSLGIHNDTLCIVSVGNCSHIKNHKLILEALGKIHLESETKCKIKYFHIGYGEDESEEKKLAERYNIQDMVVFCGFTDPLKYLKAADIYVMPSVFEGVGISALEALAMGIPSILTDVYGLKDFKELKSESIQFIQLNVESLEKSLRLYMNLFTEGLLKNDYNLSAKVSEAYDMQLSIQNYYSKYQKSGKGKAQ